MLTEFAQRIADKTEAVDSIPGNRPYKKAGGAGLKRISDMLQDRKIGTSVDKIYDLSKVNQALAKVAGGGSKGKTILKIS